MINITEYFRENIKKNDYYTYHFIGTAYDETIIEYTFYDDDELILEFKKFLKKKYNEDITIRDEDRFIIMSFYLNDKGYYIKEFPEYLKRPYAKSALPELLFNRIDNIIADVHKSNKKLLNMERVRIIDNLKIVKNYYVVPEDIEEYFRVISNRETCFNDMSENEKLEMISNCIEYLLKDNSKYIKYDYSDYLGIINDEKIKEFKEKLGCYRHASKKALEEREKYNSYEKDLMIRYGLFIIETIKKKKNEENGIA